MFVRLVSGRFGYKRQVYRTRATQGSARPIAPNGPAGKRGWAIPFYLQKWPWRSWIRGITSPAVYQGGGHDVLSPPFVTRGPHSFEPGRTRLPAPGPLAFPAECIPLISWGQPLTPLMCSTLLHKGSKRLHALGLPWLCWNRSRKLFSDLNLGPCRWYSAFGTLPNITLCAECTTSSHPCLHRPILFGETGNAAQPYVIAPSGGLLSARGCRNAAGNLNRLARRLPR